MKRNLLFVAGVAALLLGLAVAWRISSRTDGEAAPGDGASATAPRSGAKQGTPGASPSAAARTPGAPGTPALENAATEADGTLRVETVTAAGPLPGARVTVYLRGPPAPGTGQPSWRIAGSGVSDASGAVVLPARPGRYLVSARHEGRATARTEVTRPLAEARTTVRLTLAPGATLEGTTVERASRAPVPLAELTLSPRTSTAGDTARWLPGLSVPEEEQRTASSDGSGAFRITDLAPGEYQLEARAPGHAPRRLTRVLVPTSGLTVEMEGSAFIEGFVELPDGSPAAKARVNAFGAGEAVEVEASEGGAFSLDVPPGAWRVSARLGDRTGAAGGRIVVGPGMNVKDVRIRLGAPATLSGLVRSKGSARPVGGAEVLVTPDGDKGDVARARTGADGRFELGGLAPGPYSVGIEARGFQRLDRTGITVLDGERFELLAELSANGRIEGTVVDGAQRPLSGVQVIPERKWRPIDGALATVTDAQGTFVLEDVPPGPIFLSAHRPGSEPHKREQVTVEEGKTHKVRIQLGDEGVLEGTVRMAGGGAPKVPATVFAQLVGGQRADGRQVAAAADGTWTLRVAAGRYQLSAWLTGVATQSGDQTKVVELTAGGTQHVDLEVREAKQPIVVTVLEPNGAPSVDAIVMASEAGRNEILVEEMTDASGRATVVADSIGSGALHIWSTNGGRRGDLLSVATTRTAVTLQLSAGGRIAGTVRSAGGRAVKGFHLLVSAVRTDEDFLTNQEQEFAGDQFVVDDVVTGKVAVTATLPDGRAGKVEVTSTSGATTRADIVVDAGGGLSGRFVDSTSGAPLESASIDVDGVTSPQTGADGRFQLTDLAPGEHRVTAWKRGSEIADRTVTLTSGKVVDLGDWKLGPPGIEPGRLGLGFGMSGNDVVVTSILPGAQVGDVRVGDIITAIDGATVLGPGEARQRELGAPGSPITLTLRRDGRPVSLTLTRAR